MGEPARCSSEDVASRSGAQRRDELGAGQKRQQFRPSRAEVAGDSLVRAASVAGTFGGLSGGHLILQRLLSRNAGSSGPLRLAGLFSSLGLLGGGCTAYPAALAQGGRGYMVGSSAPPRIWRSARDAAVFPLCC
jgi:hypothetical protein